MSARPGIPAELDRLRVGSGFDAHPLVPGRRLVLGGVDVPSERGLQGHSDGDVVAHAVTDALLGAVGGADIGERFPSNDPQLQDADSMQLLRQVVEEEVAGSWALVNLDVVVILQSPRVAPYRQAMRESLARALDADVSRVTVRASTTDHLGFVGRGEGAAATVVCLLARLDGADR